MREMHWTYEDLERTPVVVRTYCWDFIRQERAAQAERAEREEREAKRKSGASAVER